MVKNKIKNLLYSHKCELPPEDDIVVKYIDSGYLVKLRRQIKRLLIVDSTSKRSISFLKSRTAIRYEQQRNLEFYYYTIHPFSFFRRRWEEFMCLVIFCMLVAYPLQIASTMVFDYLVYFRYIIDTFLIADIFVTFYTGILNQQTRKIILDRKFIAKDYVLTFFFPDVIACFNVHFACSVIFDCMEEWIKIVTFVRLLKFATLWRYLNRIRENWQISNYRYKIFKLIIIPMIALFWFGALFYINGFWFDERWLPLEKREVFSGFLTCLYRSINCFFLFGNTVDSKFELSIIIEIISMTIGLIFYLFLMAQILQIVNKYNSASNKYYQITQEMGEYMKYKRLPESIRSKMYEYFVFRFQKNFYREAEIMSTISVQLQEEVLIRMCKGALECVPIFKDLPTALLVKIAKGMKNETYLENDVIVYCGTHGDSMYFLTSGTVAIYTSYNKEVAHLADGSYFGEIYLVLDDEKRVATVVATEHCELYNLSRKDFLRAISDYPEFFERIKTMAKERLQKTLDQISRSETLDMNKAQQELLEKYNVQPQIEFRRLSLARFDAKGVPYLASDN